ncbi:DUF423 domain-containing protein [Amorphus sp. 3PC139-8]|uniref:DUF423 domain-containing protein n=1 Tax=Amorphus sp. 3PC139-8 TaxID=2735676 RepID=UPI00345D5CE8
MRIWLIIGALNGFLAVALGAFAAHGLRGSVPEADLTIFNTGAHYHLVHAVALVVVALVGLNAKGWPAKAAGILFLIGIVLFSGSLYFLGITGSRALVMITPVGGVAFLLGWLSLAMAGLRLKPTSN